MLSLITQAPWFVWPLFFILIAYGLYSTNTRQVHLGALYGVAVFSLWTVGKALWNAPSFWAVTLFLLMFFAGYRLGYWKQRDWILGRTCLTLTVRGEGWTLTTVMVLFFANYVWGVLGALRPELVAQSNTIMIYYSVLLFASATFAGRAVRSGLWDCDSPRDRKGVMIPS